MTLSPQLLRQVQRFIAPLVLLSRDVWLVLVLVRKILANGHSCSLLAIEAHRHGVEELELRVRYVKVRVNHLFKFNFILLL